MKLPHKAIVIMPAFNEAAHLREVIEDIRTHLPFEADIVVIDDGSADDTASQALIAGAIVLKLPYNLGIGGAVQTGYRYAASHQYDVAIRLDGDGQHDPSDLPSMLQALSESDMVIGSRFLNKQGYQSTWMRMIGIYTLSKLVGVVTGKRVTDPTSGYHICNKTMIHLFAAHYPTDYPEVESLIMMNKHRCRFTEIAVTMKPRTSGKSSISAWRSIYYMVKVILAVLIMHTRKIQPSSQLQKLEGSS